MDTRVRAVLDEVATAAAQHDAGIADRLLRWRVLEEDAGQLLAVLVRATGAHEVVEVGTSRGVSTLWLADAVRATGGRVVSLDPDAAAQAAAAENVARAGLADHVTFTAVDGGSYLARMPDAAIDLLFLDAERTEYPGWWPHPLRVLRPGGLLVADNATSHPDEIAPFAALLRAEPGVTTTIATVGKGELIAVRDPY
ncbi:O-methyltransferase [Pseudonocardia sp. CA-107938]|uniref:O-methyltransferase n=1 Tax=Pseudonocardia sp. CA-107938 TaxID=3240021 RepID=UPI003D8FB6F0